MGERCVGTLRTGDEAAGEHADDDHDENDERALLESSFDDDGADRWPPGREDERGNAPARTARQSIAHLPHGQPTGPNGLGRPSLPGLRMPFGSSACFNATSVRTQGRARRRRTGAVQADAVVMAQRAAGRARPAAPRPRVRVVPVFVRRARPCREGEVEAAAVEVAVRLVRGCGESARHPSSAATVSVVDARKVGPPAGDLHGVDHEARARSAPRARRRRCDVPSIGRRARVHWLRHRADFASSASTRIAASTIHVIALVTGEHESRRRSCRCGRPPWRRRDGGPQACRRDG